MSVTLRRGFASRNRFAVARELIAVAVAQYQIDRIPRILFWTQWYREYCSIRDLSVPVWAARWCKEAKIEMDKYKPILYRILRDELRVSAVKVNAKIRELLKHGSQPLRDDDNLMDEWYKDCIANSRFKGIGFALFPSGEHADVDHPLQVTYHRRDSKSAATRFAGSLQRIDESHISGRLETKTKNALVQGPQHKAEEAIERIKRPLLTE